MTPRSTHHRLLCRYSEQSRTKCIGMTIETRPDFCLTPHLTQMLSYGCTRLEIGLQSTFEDVARDTNRGHTVAAVGECFRLAKDAGFKASPGFPCPGCSARQCWAAWAELRGCRRRLTQCLPDLGHPRPPCRPPGALACRWWLT